MCRRTKGPIKPQAADNAAALRIKEDRLERELRSLTAKMDSYYYQRARCMTHHNSGWMTQIRSGEAGVAPLEHNAEQPQGSISVNGQPLPYQASVGNPQGRDYSYVLFKHPRNPPDQNYPFDFDPRKYRFLYRGTGSFYEYATGANPPVLGQGVPNVPLQHQPMVNVQHQPVHHGVGGPGQPATRSFIHLAHSHTSYSIYVANRFGGRAIYVLHLESPNSAGIPYLSYDKVPISPIVQNEKEILLPRNCQWQVDPRLQPRTLEDARIVYSNGQLQQNQIRWDSPVYGSVPWQPNTNAPAGSPHQFHQVLINGAWKQVIHCRLLPPFNHLRNMDHNVINKKISEKFVFPYNSNPKWGYDGTVLPPPAPGPHNPAAPLGNLRLKNLNKLRGKIVEWFNSNKTFIPNPYSPGNNFNAGAKIIHSSDAQMVANLNNLNVGAVAPIPVDNEFTFLAIPGQPAAQMFGGKKKKKKKTKKKNRKTKNKTSRKKR